MKENLIAGLVYPIPSFQERDRLGKGGNGSVFTHYINGIGFAVKKVRYYVLVTLSVSFCHSLSLSLSAVSKKWISLCRAESMGAIETSQCNASVSCHDRQTSIFLPVHAKNDW